MSDMPPLEPPATLMKDEKKIRAPLTRRFGPEFLPVPSWCPRSPSYAFPPGKTRV
jgi:hypothetical protein